MAALKKRLVRPQRMAGLSARSPPKSTRFCCIAAIMTLTFVQLTRLRATAFC